MHLYEHQVKGILSKRGFNVPKGVLARNEGAVRKSSEEFGFHCIAKAQVLTGGRGKAGAVVKVRDGTDVDTAVSLLRGSVKGLRVNSVLVEEFVEIKREVYAAVMTDRKNGCPLVMLSSMGGVEIEEVALTHPESIFSVKVDVAYGFHNFMAREMAFSSGVDLAAALKLALVLSSLYQMYWEKDAELLEINPLALTAAGEWICVDAKMSVDNNALFRNHEIKAAREETLATKLAEGGPRERLIYVPLDGNIGIMGTGAGMTMATIDQVVAAGGRAASFIDCGSAMRYKGPEKAIKLLIDKGADVILISTYTGGRSQMAAEGITKALDEMPDLKIPVVVRIQGKNDEEAFEILSRCKHPALRISKWPDEAVQIAVQLANQGKSK